MLREARCADWCVLGFAALVRPHVLRQPDRVRTVLARLAARCTLRIRLATEYADHDHDL